MASSAARRLIRFHFLEVALSPKNPVAVRFSVRLVLGGIVCRPEVVSLARVALPRVFVVFLSLFMVNESF